jgi:hypothetical protein
MMNLTIVIVLVIAFLQSSRVLSFEVDTHRALSDRAVRVSTVDPITGGPTSLDPSILMLPQNPLASIPVSRITDAADPQQAQAVPSAGTNQGMAEYSNANFLSGDTIFKNFTFPRIQSIDLNNPILISNRRYFQKVSDGDTGYLLVAEGSFTERLLALASNDKGFVLDRLVYDSYASRLLPRAVGYSAGLIDYFFRGRMESENLSGSFAPSCPSCPRTQLTAAGILRNLLAPGEGLQQVQGQQQLVAVFLTQENNQTVYHVSSPSTVNLTDEFLGEITFDFSSNPIPVHPDVFYQNWPCTVVGGSVPCEIQFIYRGPLGKEVDSVIVLNATMDID